MTKAIILVHGPDNGRVETVPATKKRFIVIHPKPPEGKKIFLSMRQGIYKQTGEYDGLREIFLWWGWKDKSK